MIHVLLPAYNEEDALGRVLEGIGRALADGDFRVWVVDDGSRDGTARVAQDWASRMGVVLLKRPRNGGLGCAFQTGLSFILSSMAPSDMLVTLDADNTHPPQLIPHLLQPLEDGRADVVIASRFAPGGQSVGVPWPRRLSGQVGRLLFSSFFRLPGVSDYTGGFRAYRGELLLKGQKKWRSLVTEAGFVSSLEWLVKLSCFSPRVMEVPLVLRYDRKPTPSKRPAFPTLVRTLLTMNRFRKMCPS